MSDGSLCLSSRAATFRDRRRVLMRFINKTLLRWREPGVIRNYARENTPASVRRAAYRRYFKRIFWCFFLLILGGLLFKDGQRGESPDLLRTFLVSIGGAVFSGLLCCAGAWSHWLISRPVDPEICFCKDHIQYFSVAGIARLEYSDIRLCRFRTITLGEQQVDVMEIQTSEGFATIEIHPSVSRGDIERVLKQKQIMTG
jgi:hypothetical protein